MKDSAQVKWAKGEQGVKAEMLQAIGADYQFFLLPWENLPKDIQNALDKNQ